MIDPLYGALIGMGGRMMASAGQGDPLGRTIGLGIMGGMSDYGSLTQQAQLAKQRDQALEVQKLQLQQAQKAAQQQAGREQRMGSIQSQFLGPRGIGQVSPTMQRQGLGVGDAFMPAAGLQEQQPDMAGYQEALRQEAQMQAGLAGDPRAMLASLKPTTKPTAAQQEISRLTSLGIPKDVATKIQAGVYKMTSPDSFGNVSIVDISTQKPVSTFNAQTGQAPQDVMPTEVAQATTKPEIQQAAEVGTGPWAKLKRFGNATIGLFTEGIPFKDAADAKTKIDITNKLLEGVLVNNPKFPVMEMKRVQGMLADPNAIFTDPDVEANKYKQLEEFLVTTRQINEESIPAVSTKEREKLTNQNASIDRALKILRKGSDNPYFGMSLDQLNQVDPTVLSLDEIRMMKEAYKRF